MAHTLPVKCPLYINPFLTYHFVSTFFLRQSKNLTFTSNRRYYWTELGIMESCWAGQRYYYSCIFRGISLATVSMKVGSVDTMKEGTSSEAKTILVLQGFGLEGDSWSMVPKQCSSPSFRLYKVQTSMKINAFLSIRSSR